MVSERTGRFALGAALFLAPLAPAAAQGAHGALASMVIVLGLAACAAGLLLHAAAAGEGTARWDGALSLPLLFFLLATLSVLLSPSPWTSLLGAPPRFFGGLAAVAGPLACLAAFLVSEDKVAARRLSALPLVGEPISRSTTWPGMPAASARSRKAWASSNQVS